MSLMSLVQLLYPIRTQNTTMFYSNVCEQCKCKQTLYRVKTWLNYSIDIMDGQPLHP